MFPKLIACFLAALVLSASLKAGVPTESTPSNSQNAFVNQTSQFSVMYRYRPTDNWGWYGCFSSYAEAETTAQQLISTGWEVQIVNN